MKYRRLLLGLIFTILLISLMSYCNQEYNKNDVQIKKYKQIFNNIDDYNNTEILFLAEILKINITSHAILVFIQEPPYDYPFVEISTENIDINMSILKKGDLIDIIGILDGSYHVTAKNIWVNEPWKFTLIFIRSLPAIPFVLFVFFRTWKLNKKTWYFERRKRDA